MTQPGPITTRRIALARILYIWFRLCINPDCASLTLKECVSYACHNCSLSVLNNKKHAGLIAHFAYALSCLFCSYLHEILLAPRQMHSQWVIDASFLKCISTIRPKFDRMPDDLLIFYSITTLKLE